MYDIRLYTLLGAILSVILIASALFIVVGYIISDHLRKDDNVPSKISIKNGIQYILYTLLVMIIFVFAIMYILSRMS